MLLAAATIIAISAALQVIAQGQLNSIDWHTQRGLSFPQIGLRYINQLCYMRLPLPLLGNYPEVIRPWMYFSQEKRSSRYPY
jgi:hypothetical protein